VTDSLTELLSVIRVRVQLGGHVQPLTTDKGQPHSAPGTLASTLEFKLVERQKERPGNWQVDTIRRMS
jgi:hypothetical protein